MFNQIAYIIKVNLAHLNGCENVGNIVTIKKISDYNDNEYAYISWQALRRYIKETLKLAGETISSVDKDWNPYYLPEEDDEEIKKWFDAQLWKNKAKLNSEEEFVKLLWKVFRKYIDLDLFWFMFPKGERRWSPVKVSPAVSIFPWKGETDFLTRKQLVEWWKDKSGNIVNVEIDSNNFMKGVIMIDENLVWSWENEYTYQKTDILTEEEKKERIKKILEAIRNLTWWAVQSRNLEDISPAFAIIIEQKYWNPFLLNILKIDKNWYINIDEIIETLKENWIESGKYILKKWIFTNEDEVIKKLEWIWFTKF